MRQLLPTCRLRFHVTGIRSNKIQEEFWRGGPYPPRSIVEVTHLNQDDIVEVEGTFFCPAKALSG